MCASRAARTGSGSSCATSLPPTLNVEVMWSWRRREGRRRDNRTRAEDTEICLETRSDWCCWQPVGNGPRAAAPRCHGLARAALRHVLGVDPIKTPRDAVRGVDRGTEGKGDETPWLDLTPRRLAANENATTGGCVAANLAMAAGRSVRQ